MKNADPLSIALPKGRLFDSVKELFEKVGLSFDFKNRELIAYDDKKTIKVLQKDHLASILNNP